MTTQVLKKSIHYIEPLKLDFYLLSYPFIAGLIDGDGTYRHRVKNGEIVLTGHLDDLSLFSQLANQLGGQIRSVPNTLVIRLMINKTNCKGGALTFTEGKC